MVQMPFDLGCVIVLMIKNMESQVGTIESNLCSEAEVLIVVTTWVTDLDQWMKSEVEKWNLTLKLSIELSNVSSGFDLLLQVVTFLIFHQ